VLDEREDVPGHGGIGVGFLLARFVRSAEAAHVGQDGTGAGGAQGMGKAGPALGRRIGQWKRSAEYLAEDLLPFFESRAYALVVSELANASTPNPCNRRTAAPSPSSWYAIWSPSKDVNACTGSTQISRPQTVGALPASFLRDPSRSGLCDEAARIRADKNSRDTTPGKGDVVQVQGIGPLKIYWVK